MEEQSALFTLVPNHVHSYKQKDATITAQLILIEKCILCRVAMIFGTFMPLNAFLFK